MNRPVHLSLIHILTVVLVGCGASLTDPDASETGATPRPDAAVTRQTHATLGDTVSLEVAASATFERESVEITFLRLIGDSRCPIGVTCVWEGDAEVEVGVVTDGGSSRIRLHTSLEPRAAPVANYVLRLVDVLPHPVDDPLADPAPLRIVVTLEGPTPDA